MNDATVRAPKCVCSATRAPSTRPSYVRFSAESEAYRVAGEGASFTAPRVPVFTWVEMVESLPV